VIETATNKSTGFRKVDFGDTHVVFKPQQAANRVFAAASFRGQHDEFARDSHEISQPLLSFFGPLSWDYWLVSNEVAFKVTSRLSPSLSLVTEKRITHNGDTASVNL
jgi:hypothetical protein